MCSCQGNGPARWRGGSHTYRFTAYRAAEMAVEEAFGKKPIPTRGGGSIPIVALFEKELAVKAVLLGFGLDSDNLHSPNEKYGLFNFYKGIETIPLFYRHFAAMSKVS